MFGENNFGIMGIKQFTVTEDFLALDMDVKNCQTETVNKHFIFRIFRYLIFNGNYTPTTEVVHREDWLVTCLDIFVFSSFCMQVAR